MAEDRAPEPGSGNVEIELDGKQHTLEPTLEACMRLAQMQGGVGALIARCSNYDFNTIVEVIAAGLGANPGQKDKLVAPAVFKAGMINVAPSAIRFLRAVLHGGTLPAEDDDDDDQEGRQEDPLVESESQSGNSTAA